MQRHHAAASYSDGLRAQPLRGALGTLSDAEMAATGAAAVTRAVGNAASSLHGQPQTKLLRGLCAFPITPQTADGVVRADVLSRLVARLLVPGVDSIGLLGSTGT